MRNSSVFRFYWMKLIFDTCRPFRCSVFRYFSNKTLLFNRFSGKKKNLYKTTENLKDCNSKQIKKLQVTSPDWQERNSSHEQDSIRRKWRHRSPLKLLETRTPRAKICGIILTIFGVQLIMILKCLMLWIDKYEDAIWISDK